MKRYLLAAVCGLLLSNTTALATGVPLELSYQAYVTDDSGNPLANGPEAVSYDVAMRIYDQATGGNLLWSEQHTTKIHKGRFAIILGQGQEIPTAGAPEARPALHTIFTDINRFTEITVRKAGDEWKTLLPRQRLVATATSLRARFAEEAQVANSLAPGAIPPGSLTGSIFSNGSVDGAKIGGQISSGRIANGSIDDIVFERLHGLRENAQSQLDGKANLSGGNNFTGNQTFTTGNVRIGGSSTPPRGKLEVRGATTYEGPPAYTLFFLGDAFVSNDPFRWNQFNNRLSMGIYADNSIMAPDFRAFSDARIKRILSPSDSVVDLEILDSIEITNFTHKDTIAHGTKLSKKVIAQQVEKVFPLAVSKSTDVVPDIYQVATVDNGWLKLTTNLEKGERIRLIVGESDGIYEVIEVKEGAFKTAWIPEADKVFVYGREVTDFLSVDYTAIAMLNVSATQEILRRLESKEKEVDKLKTRLREMDAKMATIEKVLAAQKTPESVSTNTLSISQ